MCGIVGFITEENANGLLKREAFLEQGLVIDILRGEDSTGVMYGNRSPLKAGHCGYAKDATDGYSFIKSKGFVDVTRQMRTIRFAVGHNRAATIGNISTATAHPFQEQMVTGVHNGTVRGGMKMLPIDMIESKASVDSECLMMNLNHVDPKDAAAEVLANIDGAYMLVWHDGRDHTLNFARNDTRTFHFAQSYEQDTLYFASEAGQLQWLGERNDLGIGDVVYLKPGKHLKFSQGSLEPEVIGFEPCPKFRTPAVTRTTPATFLGGSRHYAGWMPPPGGQAPGKPYTAPAMGDNRILVGGVKREVPEKLQEGLLDMELAVEDRLCFTPIQSENKALFKNPNSRRFVLGFLDSLSATALIYNVEAHVIEHGFSRRWTVRPVGVQYTDKEQTKPIVVCELVAAVNQIEKMTLKTKHVSRSSDSSIPTAPTAIGGYPGPAGSYVSKADWMELTEGGCFECDVALVISDAPVMDWEGNQPRCKDCTDKHHDEIANEIAATYFDNMDDMLH